MPESSPQFSQRCEESTNLHWASVVDYLLNPIPMWKGSKKRRDRRLEAASPSASPHVKLNLATIGVKGLRTLISPHASENVVPAHVRMTLEVGDLVFAGEDAVQWLIVWSDRVAETELGPQQGPRSF
ncbi:jg7986 [Pararge aegeria aegeria]|uniref:Jg7986 protein n=1 Tax=Pararge aegeria aegeria TaxID=348720 RepID=A0A8S4SCL3_9NEOP|nr:jg7986 [Pararge aegeria aegeria]